MAAHIEIKNTQLQRKRIWEYDFFPIRYDVAPINIHKINIPTTNNTSSR